jgi:outer membrane receptor for Fe3+-dicitrate
LSAQKIEFCWKRIDLDEIVIQQQLSALNVISKIDLETTPVNSSQEILRKVPGLFIDNTVEGKQSKYF